MFIDAGHGGIDSGAIGINIIEKEFNLLISTKVAEKIKGYDCDVKCSRNSDKSVTLEERCKLSNEFGSDIFVSIHCNSFTNPNATGFESFVYKGTSTLQNNVHNEIAKEIKLVDRGKKTNSLYVLKHTKARAVLLELGFISNSVDSNVLSTNVDKIVNSIVRGIVLELGLTPISTTRDMYRVCVGSYSVKENADNMMKQLEKDGYKPFIAKVTL